MKFDDVAVPKFNLADAVALHTELNPKLWQDNELRPEVRARLLEIAEDFIAFIGVSSLSVKDIVIIGSNVAYSYTPHSDLDLHVVVDYKELNRDSVYSELFSSKKYQYNDMHNIKIRGINVELYVQDSTETPASLGMYSVQNNEWLVEPKRRPFTVNDKETKSKYTQLRNQAIRAIRSKKESKVTNALEKINRARKSGLASSGEFSPENLAFKALRTQGIIDQLWKEQAAIQDAKLSLESRQVSESQDLMEINMSPSNLASLVSKIDALAGMEFEMYVPDTGFTDQDYDQDPDYSYDERVRGFNEIISFFDDGSYNGRSDIRNLERNMVADYEEWLTDEFANRWESDESEFVYTYLRENASTDDIAEILGREDDSDEVKENYGKKEYAEAVDVVIEKGYSRGNTWYSKAYEAALEDFNSEDRRDEWATDRFRHMSDVETEYTITWPYWETPGGGDTDIDEVASAFEKAVGRNVKASSNYHGERRDGVSYILEPDGSLDSPNDITDGGLEFVSPPLPINELLSDLAKVKKWADQTGCYTNESTGLHINVSIKNVNTDNLDYVKLALLLGDQYVLDKFERLGNNFCKSAVDKIRTVIVQGVSQDKLQLFMDQMKSGLSQLASRIIMEPSAINKYTSIHPKDGYIEFRSPGGDWLNEKFDEIEATLLRMVVVLDAAYDPEKYRQEYLTKLYKMISPPNQQDILSYFAKYAAGTIPKAALKSFIKQAQLQRSTAAAKAPAASATAATAPAAQPATFPAPSSSGTRWKILIGGRQVFELDAANQGEANAKAAQWLNQRSAEFRSDYGLDRRSADRPDVEVLPK